MKKNLTTLLVATLIFSQAQTALSYDWRMFGFTAIGFTLLAVNVFDFQSTSKTIHKAKDDLHQSSSELLKKSVDEKAKEEQQKAAQSISLKNMRELPISAQNHKENSYIPYTDLE